MKFHCANTRVFLGPVCARAPDADRTRHFSQYVYFNQNFSSAPFPFRASRLQACDRTHPSVAAAYMAVALAFGSSERSKMVNSIVVHTNITYTNTSCLHTHTHILKSITTNIVPGMSHPINWRAYTSHSHSNGGLGITRWLAHPHPPITVNYRRLPLP